MPGLSLPKSEDAFRISMPDDERGRMVKQIKGHLNKITPEKYEDISSQIVAYFEPTTSDAIVPLIFEKALNELTFAEMYADLFRDLLRKVATCTQSHTTFLMALMLRCNLELTKALQADEAEEEKNKDKPDLERKTLKRSVGIAQFISELYVRDMLKEDFLFKVASKLLHLSEPTGNNVKHIEAEVACKLIETAGQHWEATSNRFTTDVLPRLVDLCDNHPRPRIRFMLLDLQDLRKRGWKSRFNKQKPKKLDGEGVIRQGSRPSSPLNLREGLSSLGLTVDGRHDPYGEAHCYMSEYKPRCSTPPPMRGVAMADTYSQRKRGMTPPPQRMMPFMAGYPLELPTVVPGALGSAPNSPMPMAVLPLPSSQPTSPAPVYQHNPYGYTSPQLSPQPSPQPQSAQMQWAEVAQTGWQSTGMEEPPHWQQQGQMHYTDQMGWQTPDSSMGWIGAQNWTGEQQQHAHQMAAMSPPMSPQHISVMGNMPGQLSVGSQHLPMQMPIAVLRQPIPIVDPKNVEHSPDSGIIQIGASKTKFGDKGPPSAGGRRDSPLPRPMEGGLMDGRPRSSGAPEFTLPVDPASLEPILRPGRSGPSRALPIELPPARSGGTPPRQWQAPPKTTEEQT